MTEHIAVCSGSSARLWWEGGVLDELTSRGVRFSAFLGTSGGAFIAALGAAGKPARLGTLAMELDSRALWGDRGGILERLATARRLLTTGALLDPSGLRQLIEDELPDDTLDRIPPRHLVVTSFDLLDGRTHYHRPEKLQPEDFRDALLASAALPLALPPVRVRGRPQIDGGVLDNVPLEEIVYFLRMDPERAENACLWVLSALQPYPSGRKLRGGAFAALLEALNRAVAASLHREATRSLAFAERHHVDVRWIQAPAMKIHLTDFTRAEAIESYELGRRSAEREVGRRALP